VRDEHQRQGRRTDGAQIITSMRLLRRGIGRSSFEGVSLVRLAASARDFARNGFSHARPLPDGRSSVLARGSKMVGNCDRGGALSAPTIGS